MGSQPYRFELRKPVRQQQRSLGSMRQIVVKVDCRCALVLVVSRLEQK
jgi:hypothetical protein